MSNDDTRAPVSAQGGAAGDGALRWRAHALANEHLDVCVVRPGFTKHGVFCDSVLAALARIREEARAEALREAAAVVGEYARQLQVNSTVGIEAFWAAKEAVERVERLAASTGGGRDEGDEMSDRWRVGRTLGRTLYLDGRVCGMVDTPEMAAAIVAAMNATPPVPGKASKEQRALLREVLGVLGDDQTVPAWSIGLCAARDRVYQMLADIPEVAVAEPIPQGTPGVDKP